MVRTIYQQLSQDEVHGQHQRMVGMLNERFPLAAPLLDHLLGLGPVRYAPALGLVHVLSGHDVAVGFGVVPQCPELGGNRQVNVLPDAGHPGVEGRLCRWL